MNTALATRRSEALRAYEAVGLPGRRVEDWKYTDLRSVLGDKPIERSDMRWELKGFPDGAELFDLKMADEGAPDWVLQHLGTFAKNRNAMDAASFAFARGGFALRIPRHAKSTAPIHLRWSGSGNSRALIVLEEGVSAILCESVHASGMQNIGVEFVIGQNVRFTHVRLGEEDKTGVLVEEVRCGASARCVLSRALRQFRREALAPRIEYCFGR